MFIKLTRLDNRPVWLNASFIVTVEPRRDGNGAVVVPIGDGLDYDVRESPETVLGMLAGAPVPTVVPVPVSDCLTKPPDDVSPAQEPKFAEAKPEQKPAEQKSAAKSEGEKPAEKKPRKRTTRAKAKAAEEKPTEAKVVAEVEPAPAKKEEPAPVKIPELELSPDQVARLAKLAPKSIGKLKNTLATQFHVADVGGTVLALEAKGAFTLEGNRVVWPAPLADW